MKRCAWCVHYRWKPNRKSICAKGNRLLPCDEYLREPGADDDRDETEGGQQWR